MCKDRKTVVGMKYLYNCYKVPVLPFCLIAVKFVGDTVICSLCAVVFPPSVYRTKLIYYEVYLKNNCGVKKKAKG